MNNTYSKPECEVIGIRLEKNILSGQKSTGTSSGQNMDAPDYSQNPF